MNKVSRQHIKRKLRSLSLSKSRLVALFALLFFSGAVWAQTDPQFVIKKGEHYLAHVNDALQDVTSFDPATCLWYSGPNIKNNYYYMKGSTRQYLLAPLELNGALSLHPNPGTVVLNTTSDNYYFYAWDHGVARGVQLPDLENCEELYHGLNNEGNQCWKVVWLSYYNPGGWKMSSAYGYNIITEVAALYHRVSITEYDEVITNESGGITNLVLDDFAMDYTSSPHASHPLNGTASPYSYDYTPAYTAYGLEAVVDDHFIIPEEFHYDYGDGVIHDDAPGSTSYSGLSTPSYEWRLSGEGAQYLSFSDSQNEQTSSSAEPTLWYYTQNTTNSHKLATLTLTVTYSTGATQTRSATVTVKTECQNPAQALAPVVAFEGVTVSWLPTADSYTVSWRKVGESSWTSASVGNVTSYTITNLEGSTEYEYKVKADCSSTEPTQYPKFMTKPLNAVILGSVFGGGRMANVTGKTEVVIVNCDSIGAVYGGNDIAGTVEGYFEGNPGVKGSTITLGVDTGDPYASTYGTTDDAIGIRIGDVYGGGNGYYAYGTNSIQQAAYNTTYDVANGASIKAFNALHPEGEVVWTNNTGSSYHLVPPTIPKADIYVTNDYVKIDSLFGGAKNAILNNTTNDVNITIDGGTIFTVFGGNNFGGSLGYQSHENIIINNTTVKTTLSDYQANRMGRDFGIAYLFGGGNKVQGQNVGITVNGGQMDTIFGGGNSADVRSTQMTVNCALGAASSGNQFGNVFSNAISSCTGSGTGFTLTIKDEENYKWEGKGIYNIRTLFGGNNRADMAGVPTLNLTSGGIGTVYGGGNAGDMTAQETDDCTTTPPATPIPLVINDNNVKYGTHVKTESPYILIDYLYGGCQMSNVYYSTWVEIKGGHIGTVYGGCNISGDVGSTKINLDAPAFVGGEPNINYQKVYGAPYVVASGGTVYQNIFAGSNGLYHCKSSDEIYYIEGIHYDPDHSYVGLTVPTHNETYVIIQGDVLVKHNVYAGGNMASVGFPHEREAFPELVGLASVHMSGGTVDGNVFGGGNMASIYGSNEVQVSGGSIGVRLKGALYGGNDRLGKAGATSNRILPDRYNVASDGYTSLLLPEGEAEKVKTYVGVTGNPTIHTVYGGGNGAYDYNVPNLYCDATDLPIQSNIFVDIAIDGGNGTNGTGHITNVYGGGNGVYADGYIKVFLNVQDANSNDGDHVDTIYGGNNMGNLSIVPDIILLNGNVHTVYGGCNSGAMAATGNKTKSFTIDGTTYNNISSYVRLLNTYPGLPIVGGQPSAITPTAKVTGAVYGGCRMNGVTHNSLVCVEGGDHSGADFFGGSDISGDVSGISYVVVNGSYANSVYDGIVRDAYGGGNGNYDYTAGSIYEGKTPPYCVDSRVVMLGGKAANLYAGGYAGECGTTSMLVDGGLVTGSVFGGGNMAGLTTSHDLTTTTIDEYGTPHTSTTTSTTDGSSIVTVSGGAVNTGVYGGCNSSGSIAGNVEVNVTGGQVGASYAARGNVHGGGYGADTQTAGNVTVNIGAAPVAPSTTPTGTANIYGDIYGGSALGQVSASDKLTQVNFYKGTVNGDVYGGGLGDADHPAEVSGDVEVNVYGGVFNDAGGNGNLGYESNAGGRIFGCNNAKGSPKGDVSVNIYATDHGVDAEHNLYPTLPTGQSWDLDQLAANANLPQAYAIKSVFGGGNLAAYVPDEVTSGDPHSATVHVYNCNNTIKDVFGGGNSADVGTGVVSTFEVTRRANTYVIIDGGRFHRVIGGGNGEDLLNPAANIYGTANTTVYAGLIDEVYGGANMQGSVDGINLVMDHSGACDAEVYGAVFGCANAADYNRSVTTTIKCGVGTIGQLYGGSNQAFIGVAGSDTHADVTLNVYGGTHDKVFAGSKGIAGSPGVPAVPANIYGDVTLNLYGGTITHAFGGSDANGNIAGVITVNVLDVEGTCPLDVTNVYGASNQTAYNPDDVSTGVKPISPVVNVIHIKQTEGVRNNVYGGGNLALVTSNPQVNIGYHSSMLSQIPTNYPIAEASRRAYVSNNVYGGGNEAGVTGDPVINMREKGTVVSGIYGGCNANGTVTGDINVNIYGGTLGTSSSRMTEGIFGGGKGHPTGTTGDITVTVDDNETNHIIYADVYGGSALGQVGAAGKTALVDFKNGTLYGTIYGGGMGEGTTSATAAEVTGNTEIAISGGMVKDGLYGGCNVNGIVKGSTTVGITNGTIGESSNADRGIVYGGGLGQYTKVKGDVTVTVNNPSGHVYGDVYGGSAKGLVNCNEAGTGATAGSKTDVTLTAGTIHGDLYGGGLGDLASLGTGHADIAANVWGPVTVAVNGSEANVDNVFGCNNQNGAPQNSVTVNISNGKVNSVFGGGNVAAYTYTTDQYPNVNISGGEVTHKVVGGGNAANVTGNPLIQISGGRLCTEETGVGAGVYGGCYATGIVDGNITINITNADGNTEIGTMEALEAENPVSVHGGGYGSGTSTTGNVLVNFGTDNDGTHSYYPHLNGDLYGGSALGNVNSGAEDQTIVNIMNGSFGYVEHTVGNFIDQFGGNIYGGGLGDVASLGSGHSDVAAKVWGIVHVNIGAEPVAPATTPKGKASLIHCNVYGCNNLNGSPQQDVYVDVYQTNHITTDYADYTDELTRTFAIRNVFGGGNRSHYHPDVNTGWAKRTHNYIHYCENTVEIVYAGGNASDCDGVWLTVDGGRFDFVFGGGNGQRVAANVGEGSTIIYLRGGLIGWYFVGCNLHGTIGGTIEEHQGCDPTVETCCDVFKVEKYYFGANEATIYDGITNTIDCSQASFYNFRYVYAGSRLAVVYGDIKLTVQGGTIGNLFGGSEGSADISADVRKYPVSMADIVNFPAEHQQGLTDHLTLHPEDLGGGGNIILTINGGTIGNVFGGNDFRGNVEGTITVIIDSIPGDCPLDINYVYGGNNKARYAPRPTASGAFPDSPHVEVQNGHVNGAVYGGSKGGDPNHNYGNGVIINSNPQVLIGDDITGHKVKIGGVLHTITPPTMGEGNVFGGGMDANITGSPTVTLQGKVVGGKSTTTIEGNVFGGAKSGNVDGSTNVIIVPTSTP